MEWDSKSCGWNGTSKVDLQDNMLESGISSNDMFSVDLKLGRLEHMRDVSIDTLHNSRALTMASSSSPISVSSKRGRARGVGVQSTVYCSVDGCSSDLSQGREYHRRHRVCERHSKTPVVLIAGIEQRFCQQCSRFHSLGEFDDAKRSCRKRLDGHNRRRRKSQTENIYMTYSGGGFQTHTGSELLQFCCPDNRPVIYEPEKTLYGVNHPVTSFWNTSCVTGDKRPPYFSGINQQTFFQSSPNGITSTGTMTSSLDALSDRVTELAYSECALSLLSRNSAQSSRVCMGPTIPPLSMSSSAQVSSTAVHLDYSSAPFLCSKGLEDDSSASLSSTSTNNNSHVFGGFHSGQDEVSVNRSSRVFPFSW